MATQQSLPSVPPEWNMREQAEQFFACLSWGKTRTTGRVIYAGESMIIWDRRLMTRLDSIARGATRSSRDDRARPQRHGWLVRARREISD